MITSVPNIKMQTPTKYTTNADMYSDDMKVGNVLELVGDAYELLDDNIYEKTTPVKINVSTGADISNEFNEAFNEGFGIVDANVDQEIIDVLAATLDDMTEDAANCGVLQDFSSEEEPANNVILQNFFSNEEASALRPPKRTKHINIKECFSI